MNYPVGVIFACLAMAIIIGMVYQALSYARGRQIISRRQFGLRMANGVLLLATIGLVFYAAVMRFTEPLTVLIIWGLLTLLPIVVIVLAWLDLRELARAHHVRQAELYRSLASIQTDLAKSSQTRPDIPPDEP